MKNARQNLLNRRLLLGVGAVIIVIFLLVAYSVLRSNRDTEPKRPSPTASVNANTRRVFVKDFYKLESSISPEVQQTVENALYGQALYANQQVPDLFTGVIRSGSYSYTSTDVMQSAKFLVDVEPVNVTYRVTVNEFKEAPRSVLVSCAPKEQQMDQSATCKELDGIV